MEQKYIYAALMALACVFVFLIPAINRYMERRTRDQEVGR